MSNGPVFGPKPYPDPVDTVLAELTSRDTECLAIETIVEALEDLDDAQLFRVLSYIGHRYGERARKGDPERKAHETEPAP